MKRLFLNFKIVLLFAAMLALFAFTPSVLSATGLPPGEKPLGWNDGSYPLNSYQIMPSENKWYQQGDSVYSAFLMDGKFYASGVKWSKSSVGFAMAFKTTNDLPVKTGFVPDDSIYWGVWRGNVIKQLILKSSYVNNHTSYAVFEIAGDVLPVVDNPYYSLNLLWPDVSEFKIDQPKAGKWLYFRNVFAYRPMMPKYVEGSCKLEICEGAATIRNGKTFNETQIKFSAVDISRGYIRVIIRATPLKNSTSTRTHKEFKLYWSE